MTLLAFDSAASDGSNIITAPAPMARRPPSGRASTLLTSNVPAEDDRAAGEGIRAGQLHGASAGLQQCDGTVNSKHARQRVNRFSLIGVRLQRSPKETTGIEQILSHC